MLYDGGRGDDDMGEGVRDGNYHLPTAVTETQARVRGCVIM